MNSNILSHEEISQRAQQIWRQSGCLDGHDDEYWLQAERELHQEREQTMPATEAESISTRPETRNDIPKRSPVLPRSKPLAREVIQSPTITKN